MQQQVVTLPKPITLDGETVSKITITREPIGSEMGQYTAFDLMEGNLKALAYVLPKITRPQLSRKMILALGATNQLALTGGFVRFFDGLDLDGLVETVDTTKTETTIPTTKSPAKAS